MSENRNEINNNLPQPGTSQSSNNNRNNVWPQRMNWVKCDICNVYLTSRKLLEVHLRGKKHNLIAQRLRDTEWSYTCHICDVHANGRMQYAEHIAGRVHRSRVEELKGCRDFYFFFMYTAVATLLIFIIAYYILYFMFTYINY